uniref:Uncharacterized protein n=1 Tax=Anguilla anguilla TaxID=7936 RepID=A0A0E9PJR5_ANGAN
MDSVVFAEMLGVGYRSPSTFCHVVATTALKTILLWVYNKPRFVFVPFQKVCLNLVRKHTVLLKVNVKQHQSGKTIYLSVPETSVSAGPPYIKKVKQTSQKCTCDPVQSSSLTHLYFSAQYLGEF